MLAQKQKSLAKNNVNAHMGGSICDLDGENKCHICIKKQAVIDYLTKKVSADMQELKDLGVKEEELAVILAEMLQEGIIEKMENQATMYKLKD